MIPSNDEATVPYEKGHNDNSEPDHDSDSSNIAMEPSSLLEEVEESKEGQTSSLKT